MYFSTYQIFSTLLTYQIFFSTYCHFSMKKDALDVNSLGPQDWYLYYTLDAFGPQCNSLPPEGQHVLILVVVVVLVGISLEYPNV